MSTNSYTNTRFSANAWDDPKFVAAIEKTGRKNLIMAGVTIDVCLAFAAMQAVDVGYNVYGVVDASGGLEVTIRENAVARMKDHEITPINWTTVAADVVAGIEIARLIKPAGPIPHVVLVSLEGLSIASTCATNLCSNADGSSFRQIR